MRICSKERREKDTSRQPMFGDDSNCKGLLYFFKASLILGFIIIDISFETTSSKLIPLQLFGFEESPFLEGF